MLEITRLNEEHLEDAAVLVSSRYGRLLEQEPLLPHRYRDVSNLLPLLHNIHSAGPGVAAVRDGRLVGFLAGWLMPSFRGKRSAFSPEWANAADLEDSQTIYEEMYSCLAADWVADSFVAHYISLFANDPNAIRAWHWLSFGMLSVDAIRSLQPIEGVDAQINIRRAKLQDLEQILTLNDELRQYMKGPPVYFIAEELSESFFRGFIEAPGNVI